MTTIHIGRNKDQPTAATPTPNQLTIARHVLIINKSQQQTTTTTTKQQRTVGIVTSTNAVSSVEIRAMAMTLPIACVELRNPIDTLCLNALYIVRMCYRYPNEFVSCIFDLIYTLQVMKA